jgi:hypothetical protein
VFVDVISVSAVLYIINFANCYQNGLILSSPSFLPASQRCKLNGRVQYEIVSGRLGTFYNFLLSKKGKAIPLQPLTGPEGSRSLRLPDFMTIGT